MAWHSSGRTHEELIGNLFRNNVITSPVVRDTMLMVDRRLFTKNQPYADNPVPIGFSATISAPHMHAHALELLKDHLVSGARALDVGSGTGYLTACFALMVGQHGVAVGIEHVPELTQLATDNVIAWLNQTSGPRERQIELGRQLKLVTGDGRLGWPDEAPYDAIHVGAAAPVIPEALKQQLKVGGRLICPVGPQSRSQELVQIDRVSETQFNTTNLMGVMYVPLTDIHTQLHHRTGL